MKLSKKLNSLDCYPFHMPGHKRNTSYGITGAEIDITEIDGFDNLHNPTGLIADMEKSLTELYGSRKSIISVNGSTCCILAAISAVSKRGQDIIIARNCHKSVYNACFINELNVHYLEPEFNDEFGMYTSITQQEVDRAVKACPSACAVVITSPTYEGYISRISCDIPLIIDSAHGAHFGLHDGLPERQKGDIIIQSMHKTLPSLTQTAAVHINNDAFTDSVKMYMDIFESSSPSYILLASADRCIDFMRDCKDRYDEYLSLLKGFYARLEGLENIVALKNDDITRIVLMSKNMSGIEFADELRRYHIEAEGATTNYVILISTVCDTVEGFELLINALDEINRADGSFTPYIRKLSIPERAGRTDTDERKIISIDDSIGKAAAEYIYAYPPGVPIIAPYEIIDQNTIDIIKSSVDEGVNIISESNLLPDKLLIY